jgi:hypothetical protein
MKVQGPSQAGTAVRAVQVLHDVVHGYHIGAWQVSRHPEKVGNVHHVAMQPFDDGAKFKVAFGCAVRLQQRHTLEIRRQRSDLRYCLRRTDQEILVGAIEPAQRTHDIPGVGANPKFCDPPDINRDLHEMI